MVMPDNLPGSNSEEIPTPTSVSLHTSLSVSEQKRLFKEALREWLDDQYAELGKWALKRFGLMVVGLVAYLSFHFGMFK